MKKVFWILTGVALLLGGVVFAEEVVQQIYYPEDKSPAIRFKNISNTEIQVLMAAGDSATNSVTVITGGGYDNVVNTIDMSGTTDTVSEVVELMTQLVTNRAGKSVMEIDYNCSLGTDSTDDELSDAQNVSIQPGEIGVITWDTSDSKFFSTYIPNSTKSWAPHPSRKQIDGIYGTAGGTGDITLNIYKNGTEVFEEVITTNGVGAYTQDWTGASRLSSFFGSLRMGIGNGEDTMIRATHATTGTSGGIGVNVKTGQ